EMRGDGGNYALDRLAVGDVEREGSGVRSGFGRDGFAGREIEVGDRDLGAFAGKEQRRRAAHAARGAGDDRDTAGDGAGEIWCSVGSRHSLSLSRSLELVERPSLLPRLKGRTALRQAQGK